MKLIRNVVIYTAHNTPTKWTKTEIRRDLQAVFESGKDKYETLRDAKISIRPDDKGVVSWRSSRSAPLANSLSAPDLTSARTKS